MEGDLKTPLLPQKTPSEFCVSPTPPTVCPPSLTPVSTPSVPPTPVHPSVPVPKTQPEMRSVNCAKCHVLLQFQVGCYAVGCPFCRTQTAVQALTQFACPRCRQLLTCPLGTKLAACPCGQLSALVSS